MILISQTYELYDDKSAENGEPREAGFEIIDEPVTFRELVRRIGDEGFFYPSCSPATGCTNEWLETEPETDYTTGDTARFALHFSRKNHPRAAKYWAAAFRAHHLIRN